MLQCNIALLFITEAYLHHHAGRPMYSAKVHKEAEKHYQKFAPYQFIAYWFDLWKNYERRAGMPSPRWERATCEAVG